jgi:fatty acid desaturase
MRERAVTHFGLTQPNSPAIGRVGVTEWRTIGLALTIYASWLALTLWHAALPAWEVFPALIWLVACHGSLQHEVQHGHPTRAQAVNDAFGFTPLALWRPYPLNAPERRDGTPEPWDALGEVGKVLASVQSTLLGRVLIGPGWTICRFLCWQIGLVWRDEEGARAAWGAHLLGVAAVLVWLVGVCGFNPWLYVAGVVYPATSLRLVRAFAEPRPVLGAAPTWPIRS